MLLRALVIDDSRVMRKLVMKSLNETELAHFQFIEAEDGVDALAKFDPETVDIVFADINMPKMDGIEFVHKVRAHNKGAHVPIIMITSEKTMDKVEAALDSAGLCVFIAFAILDIPEGLEAIPEMLNARYGLKMTLDDVTKHGQAILKAERAFNTAAGFTSLDDRLPDFFKEKALGPHNVVFDVPDEQLDQLYNF